MDEAPLPKETLKKVFDAKPKKSKAAERANANKVRVPIYREPPKGQFKGPITKGVAEVIVCASCSRLFSTPEKPIRYGVRKRHAARHLQDHKMGRIRRPTEKS
jgi:hypothetical protein